MAGYDPSASSANASAAGLCGLCISRVTVKVKTHCTVLSQRDVEVKGRYN